MISGAGGFRRRGIETRLVIEDQQSAGQVDEKLVELVVQAHRWFADLKNGTASSVQTIAKRDQVNAGDVRVLSFNSTARLALRRNAVRAPSRDLHADATGTTLDGVHVRDTN